MFSCRACRLSRAPLVSLSCTPDLAQFRGEQSGQIRDRQKGEQVDEDDGLQRLESGMRGAVGRNNAVVVQFQHRPIKNEGQSRDKLRPHARQQHAGDNDDQRIKKVQRTVPAAGFVDDEADQDQIGKNLQRSLQPVLLPEGEQEHVEQRQAVPEQNGAEEQPHRQRRRSELGDGQFNRQQQGQDKIRTLTSQTSQLRSSNVDCIAISGLDISGLGS